MEHRRSDVNGRERTPLPSPGQLTTVTGNPLQHETSSRIARLNKLTAQQLRDEWRRLHRGQPPRLSRDLLIRTIAYRIQEVAYGGLSKAIQRKLAVLGKELKLKGGVVVTPGKSCPGEHEAIINETLWKRSTIQVKFKSVAKCTRARLSRGPGWNALFQVRMRLILLSSKN
jgi:hypothetical protein